MDELQKILNLKSRSEVVRQAVQFAYLFTKAKNPNAKEEKEEFKTTLRQIRKANQYG